MRAKGNSSMNKLTREKQIKVVASLVEGNSIRSTVRMTGVAKNTIVKLLANLGEAWQKYHDEHVRNLTCKRVQCDEIWSFVYAKEKNLSTHLEGVQGGGSVWTWVALDADNKLVVSWLVGSRDAEYAGVFMRDVADRLKNRVQLTTDGLAAYLEAVDTTFGADIDFAQLAKIYGEAPKADKRYSPAECIGARKDVIIGEPKMKHVSTSFIEHQNLTMRMHMRRFTRLTNAFSKKVENHAHAIALHFMYYNFVRIHQTLRVTPAMAAGVTTHLWEVGDLVNLMK